MPDKVIYTDGRDVTVTDSTLKVKNRAYSLSGITRSSLWTIRAERWPGILLTLLGLILAVCGFMGLFPADMNVQTSNGTMSANMLAIWGGLGLFVIGLILIAVARDRYAVRIATAEGEKDAVVSTKREYIAQIVDAINRAFTFNAPPPRYPTTDTGTQYIR